MPTWARVVFFVTFIGVLFSGHVYLYRRLVRDVTQHRPFRIAAVVGMALLAVVTVLLMTVFRGRLSPGTAMLFPMWFGLVMYVLVALVVADMGLWLWRRWQRGPGQPAAAAAPVSAERRQFIARSVAVGSVVAGSGLGAFGFYRAWAEPRITEVPLKLPRLPKALDGFTIVHLSDVHIGPVLKERFFDHLIARANSCKPDLVALTGDLVDGTTAQLGSVVARMRNLQSKYGTHFVTGNHDYYSGADEWVAALQGFGVTVLRNRAVTIGDAGASFDLLGVDDWGARHIDGYDLDKAAANLKADRASVLLAHQPSNFDEVAKRGIGLQLSGHTHGGQTFPATGIAQLIWGERNAGLSNTGDSHLFVSRGCGFVGPAMRLGSPPEVVKITLIAG